MPDLRRRVRLTINQSSCLATGPLRRAAALAVRHRPELGPRLAEWSWLWQPNWATIYRTRFAASVDPDNYASSPYEQQKYADIMDVLGDRHVARGLEIGCAEGVFTERLAGLCDELIAVDISDAALHRARARLSDQPHVHFEQRTLPLDYPDGSFDLIVCSDVLTLWPLPTFDIAMRTITSSLRPGGLLLLQHYRGDFGAPLTGDQVHERLLEHRDNGSRLQPLHDKSRTDINPDGRGGDGYRISLLAQAAG